MAEPLGGEQTPVGREADRPVLGRIASSRPATAAEPVPGALDELAGAFEADVDVAQIGELMEEFLRSGRRLARSRSEWSLLPRRLAWIAKRKAPSGRLPSAGSVIRRKSGTVEPSLV